ncbi:adenine phosphoribosyltransferase [Saccharomonospora xinjiangensis]|uniref:Adenine phosphoribosyltransferase n=1 Tax=Saccharomonospora xinjiangensis XJ-54 TaxID=882086 RepID=I0UXM0_9PSEU|nr:adenine phosphoribosyltransferase [Saccharomonospora xinjiangensis]EID52623.1 PRPP-binding protein, adenine/guanine phosphoribosyltransferase [Saccharomonospora xinjiangensis XJ-54]
MSGSELDRALDLIVEIPDFPEPGVLFRDLTPLFGDAKAFARVIEALGEEVGDGVDRLAAVEARGFVLAAALGYARGLGVALVRKPGKLPDVAGRVDYALEYGTATLELPTGSVREGERVAIVDDVLATGGTVAATAELLRSAGAVVTGVSVVLELESLNGRSLLGAVPVHALRAV